MTGNCRGPSSAFCLLYKFFTMKLTVNQMHGLLKHPDSPYIRAVSLWSVCFCLCSLQPHIAYGLRCRWLTKMKHNLAVQTV
uniref:Pre-mRNA-splicing factor 38 n=1 Tax=Arundo donax TaxID=35708 RepID=A0A0A9DCT3_ARUDO